MKRNRSRSSSYRLYLILALVLTSAHLAAQIVQIRPFDIAGGIKNGSIRLTTAPSSAGDTLNPFDGNRFTFLTRLQTDTLMVTLESDSLVQFEKSKVFFFSNGSWSLEAANSLSDLSSRTGSYARVVENRSYAFSSWDSLVFAQRKAKVVRLRAFNPVDSLFLLGEWTLEATVRFTSLLLMPRPVRLLPGTSFQLQVKILDDQGAIYPNFLPDQIVWRSNNPSIATIDETGKVTGVSLGSTSVTASIGAKGLSGLVPVDVLPDFRPEKAEPLEVKVALVIQDPAIQTPQGYKRIHELFNWRHPDTLASRLVFHFREATDSVVVFQFVETKNDGKLFTRYYGNFLTGQQYYNLLKEPGWPSLKAAADSGKLYFDYREFVKYYEYDVKRNDGRIDEVWVFAAPYLGMYESQLMGPNAFWWNSPPIRDGTALTKLLSVMGLNYERGVDQAFHSFGHRTESAIVQAYYQAQGRTWNDTSSSPTAWDLFTRIDKRMSGQAHVGNVHYPPNGANDYDYGNMRSVKSYAENWFRYPYLLDRSAFVNADTWRYEPPDNLAETQEHLGYLRWWYNHLPRYVGVTDGVLNNWWHYVVDYEGAVALAKATPIVSVSDGRGSPVPTAYSLEQNYPNPFNSTTAITYKQSAFSFVSLKIFDVLGREIATLVNEERKEGSYRVLWDASSFPSGVYFYRLQSGGFVETKKMVLIR